MDGDLIEMAKGYYLESDTEGAPAFLRWLAPDAEMTFNSQPPLVGPEDIVRFILGRRGPIATVRHRIVNAVVDRGREAVGLEIVVEYDSRLGNHADVPGASFLTFSNGRVSRKRVYVDPAPLRDMLASESGSRV